MMTSSNPHKGLSKISKDKIEKFTLEENFFSIDKQRADAAAEQAERVRKVAIEAEKTTAEALAKVKDEGFQQGFNSGVNQTTEKLHAETQEFIGNLAQSFDCLEQTKRELGAIFEKKSLALVKELLLKTIQDASKNYSDDILTSVISNALKEVSTETALFIKIHPESKKYIENNSNEIFENYKVTLIADNTINKGEATIEWDSSGVDARLKHIISSISGVIEASIAGVSPKNTHYTPQEEEKEEKKEEVTTETVEAEAELPIESAEPSPQPIQEPVNTEPQPTEATPQTTAEQITQPQPATAEEASIEPNQPAEYTPKVHKPIEE